MGIWSRLENVLKSYLNDDDYTENTHRTRNQSNSHRDADFNAAWEELNEFLNWGKKSSADERSGGFWQGARNAWNFPPEELRRDFAELGVSFGASAEVCKDAYKKLLKIHHPDRHAKHPGNFKKATEKTARLNAAYDRIEKWHSGR